LIADVASEHVREKRVPVRSVKQWFL
jgi:hypothetical protein